MRRDREKGRDGVGLGRDDEAGEAYLSIYIPLPPGGGGENTESCRRPPSDDLLLVWRNQLASSTVFSSSRDGQEACYEEKVADAEDTRGYDPKDPEYHTVQGKSSFEHP
ncbi:hypothetical protein GUJ93_ZPchr0002g26367 [Zizania palustris]|uniref:Uncharacterized protein n=1 Tax=Zizania palustris TaxID=103762 RepID=A0A8J5VGY2_ZIZPA|nr:hypothetical protein GUJ93_ZPchr0002g26367 [Zizania palustris]